MEKLNGKRNLRNRIFQRYLAHKPYLKSENTLFKVTVHHFRKIGGCLVFRQLIRIIKVVLKFKTQLGLPFDMEIELAALKPDFMYTSLYIKLYHKLHLKKDCKINRFFWMLSLLRKRLKSIKVFIYKICNTQSKRVFF